MIDESLLQSNFLGRDGFRWWIGQLPPAPFHNQGAEGWGNRYRVRIMGYHPFYESELANDELPWANVLLPTTGGSGKQANAASVALSPGDTVFGFFLDEECQIPVITQILGNNLNDGEDIRRSINGTTGGKRVDGYNTGRDPNQAEVTGAPRQTSQTKPTSTQFDKAKTAVSPTVKNENGVPLSVKTESWDGGREKITAKDYNAVFNSPHSTVTPTVKYNAAKAAVNSGVITQQQYQRSVAKLSRETEAKKIPSFGIGGATQ